jgi:uroporphyrinogen decarboxylase
VNPVGKITDWESFERFPWPVPSDLDFSLLDRACEVLPDGMQILLLVVGFFEPISFLMGLETLSYAIADDPELVTAVKERASKLVMAQVETALQHDQVGGIWIGDDLGFNTATQVAPDWLRVNIFPGYKRIIDLAHREGRLLFLHSCGNLEAVMDDLIDLGIDAKHSFEDKIMPVEEVYQRWGERVGILGGVDMDILARGTQEQVRHRTREILDVCGANGGFALGSGNSIADYVPPANFLAMLDEGRKWSEHYFGRG